MLIYMIKTKGTNDGRTGFRSRFVSFSSFLSFPHPSSFFLLTPLQELVGQESKSTPMQYLYEECRLGFLGKKVALLLVVW